MQKSLSQQQSISLRARHALAVALLGAAAMAPLAAHAHRPAYKSCADCGTVISSTTTQQAAEKGSGVGIAAGAVVGGLLGNQVGKGNGRTVATVAGAVGGGYAGNEIEKHAKSKPVTTVRVRMSNGSERTFTERGVSRWHAGSHVKVINDGTLARN